MPERYFDVPVTRGDDGDIVSGSVDVIMNALCVGSADTTRAYLRTHSTFQKPDKLLWMLRDRFEKACSSQGVLGQKIRLHLINPLKYVIEHVWWIEIEQAMAVVEALQSFMRLLEGFRRRPAALLRRPEPGCAAGGRRDGD